MSHLRQFEDRIYRAHGLPLPCDLCGNDVTKCDAVELVKLSALSGDQVYTKTEDDQTVDWLCRGCIGTYIEGMFMGLEANRRAKEE